MSSITIEVVDVTLEKLAKYEKLAVTYKVSFGGTVKTEAKAIMSFATPPEVWNTMMGAKKGEVYTIDREKDPKEGKYWNWVGVHRQDGESPMASAVPASNKSSFADNDAKRQRLIVRQSCLKAAVDVSAHEQFSEDDLLALADKFVKWVMEE